MSDVHCAAPSFSWMELALSVGRAGSAQCTSITKREVLPSLVSSTGEVDYVVLIDVALANGSIRHPAIGTDCLCENACDVIFIARCGIMSDGDVRIVEVGLNDELLLASFAFDTDYLAHCIKSFISATV